jgi:sulfonate transport system ATP-binding protein
MTEPGPALRAAPSVAKTSAPVVRAAGVSRWFGARQVLVDVDLELQRGEFVALLGPSGCGKSTFLKVLAGLDPDADGSFQVPERRAVVFQEPRLLPWKRVIDNVTLGLNAPRSERRERARVALEEVQLSHRAEAWPLTLSGGEAQRAALARALTRDPELLLLDEPFGALDALTRLSMHRLLAELCRKHAPAVLLVTHDVDEALRLADRVVVFGNPSRAELGPATEQRPRSVIAQLDVDVPAPRRRGDPRFDALRKLLLGHLGVEDDEASAVASTEARPTSTEHRARSGRRATVAAGPPLRYGRP